uniref:Uncharacterized protein n=1 Tax=Glossina palpalis gambiensis TaxID=67801 RepID=A0A1B0BLV1_9MUSC
MKMSAKKTLKASSCVFRPTPHINVPYFLVACSVDVCIRELYTKICGGSRQRFRSLYYELEGVAINFNVIYNFLLQKLTVMPFSASVTTTCTNREKLPDSVKTTTAAIAKTIKFRKQSLCVYGPDDVLSETNTSRGQSPYPPTHGQNSGSYPSSPQQAQQQQQQQSGGGNSGSGGSSAGGPPPPQSSNQGTTPSQYSPYPQRYPTPPGPATGPNHRTAYSTHQVHKILNKISGLHMFT